ncbi:hypothetical protein TNCV_2632731 [Trichonephila clavipes]|nr:hypothetical protein TNCV_2632731 [Trichonephila clavipes]
MSEKDSAAIASIARVLVKVPPFRRANPEIWFSQMESHVYISGNHARDKFQHLISALQPEEFGIVGNIILSPQKSHTPRSEPDLTHYLLTRSYRA